MMVPPREVQPPNGRLLATLERLLEIEATDLKVTLDQASQMVAEALGSDKVDVFLYEAASDSLVAMGTSDTPMGRQQHAMGLNRMPLANGGPAVTVYQTGRPYITGRADRDPEQLKGVVHGLGVRSEMGFALDVAGERRGVVQCCSRRTDAYSEADLRFLAAVSRWIGMVTHRAELVEQMTEAAVDRGRHDATEELISLLTPRQREIAALIASGLTNEQIADRLVLTPGTVANHVQHILQRLGAGRRTQIAAWIVEQALQRSSPDGTGP
jgi:DNA-binding CsgD family transcriptional regulator